MLGIASAQVVETPLPDAAAVTSPIPLPRTVPPAEPARAQPLDETRSVTVVIPGEDEPVTVVFGPKPEAEQGADEPLAPSDAPTDRWQGERAKRFLQAPEGRIDRTSTAADAVVPISTPETTFNRGAQVRQLDKMTGQIETYEIAVGQTLQVARLRVRLEACRAPADGTRHGTIAFLKIWDTKIADQDAVFSGWMFAKSPALSALDHQRYDFWVIKCTTSAAVTSEPRQ